MNIPVHGIIDILISLYSGSEGKLTVPPLRCGVMSGVGNLSNHTVSGSGSVQNLSAAVAEFFIPVLQQEGKIWKVLQLQ